MTHRIISIMYGTVSNLHGVVASIPFQSSRKVLSMPERMGQQGQRRREWGDDADDEACDPHGKDNDDAQGNATRVEQR